MFEPVNQPKKDRDNMTSHRFYRQKKLEKLYKILIYKQFYELN